MGRRIVYSLVGYGVGTGVTWLVQAALHYPHNLLVAGLAGGPLAVWVGERTGRLKPIQEELRPTTLFPDGIPNPR